MNKLSSCVRPLDLPLAEHPTGGWQPHPLFKGSTGFIDQMACHAAVLSAGHSPHLPHAHRHEELLVVLDGQAEVLIADGPFTDGARVERVGPGTFSYYPALQHHTIRNPGTSPVTYLMFKWHLGDARAGKDPLETTVFRYDEPEADEFKGIVTRTIFHQPTGWLGRLHCYTAWLPPGASYEAHTTAYDEAIVLLSGRVETRGQEVGPSVIYCLAGETHMIRNIGNEPARFLVFEFHAPRTDRGKWVRRRVRGAAKRVVTRVAGALGVVPARRHS